MPYGPKDRRSFNNANLTPVQVGALKKKAVSARLSLRISGRRVDLPVDVALLQSDEKGTYSYIAIPTINDVCGMNASGTSVPVDPKERDVAVKALQAVRVRTGSAKAKPETPTLPAEVVAALTKSVPAGYRVVFDNGEARLVKTRPARQTATKKAKK